MAASADERLDKEVVDVWRNRYHEARMAGLEHLEACVFAADSTDVSQLRRLVRENCPPALIARIVL
jgi:hypothetical protein